VFCSPAGSTIPSRGLRALVAFRCLLLYGLVALQLFYDLCLSHVTIKCCELNAEKVDHRYMVTASRDNEKSLVIRDVKSTDAGQFTVREEFSGQAASVDLTVIGKLSL